MLGFENGPKMIFKEIEFLVEQQFKFDFFSMKEFKKNSSYFWGGVNLVKYRQLPKQITLLFIDPLKYLILCNNFF